MTKKVSKIFTSLKRYTGWVMLSSFILLMIVIISVPAYSLKTGNLFFDKANHFYNIKIAHFFYKKAAYPIFSYRPPRYAHYQLSRVYFIEGKLEEALDEAKTELKIYPDDTITYYVLGLTLGYMGHSHSAIDAFTKYIENHPETWAGRNDKAWLQFRIGDIDGALFTIEPAAKQFKYTPWVQNTYCALLINKKNYDSALEACNNAKTAVDKMTSKDWGHAYPGNDPRIYNTGLEAMKESVNQNINLINKKLDTN